MPVIQISMLEGRDAEDRRRLVAAVTDAVVETLGVDSGQVRVLLYELPPGDWGVGGTTREEERR
jgi:4-oxalocrotonate tautomerase